MCSSVPENSSGERTSIIGFARLHVAEHIITKRPDLGFRVFGNADNPPAGAARSGLQWPAPAVTIPIAVGRHP